MFLEHVQRKNPPVTINIAPLTTPGTPEQAAPEPEKKARKPRADAGKVRGAYKPREDARQVEGAEHLDAKPEGAGAPTGVGAKESATPTPPAASTAAPLAAPSGAASPLTLADIRATLDQLNKVPNKGMAACIASIQAFGVNRISDLPPAKYAEFDAYVRAQLPKAA